MASETFDDTIAAVGTPTGEAAIGVVRVSGSLSEQIARRLMRAPGDAFPLESHRFRYGHVIDPTTGTVVDEVMYVLMRSPRSYTREDVLEIQCHGGSAAVKRVLELVLESGARPAQPGEFTKRAFLNGRIDLTQAEAVIDVIRARSDESLDVSSRIVSGELRRTILSLRDSVTDLLAQVEVAIDFPEDDVEIAPPEQTLSVIQDTLRGVDGLLQTFRLGRLFREGLDIVIAGKPNVGKSSLMNCLLREKRAIVTPHPGTTRDFIEVPLTLDGLPVRLVDTAGIRETEDEIERISLDVTRERLERADAAILVLDAGTGPDRLDDTVYELVRGKRGIIAANKRDLNPDAPLAPLRERYPELPLLGVSALTGQGIDSLKKALRESIGDGGTEKLCGPVVTRLRHERLLLRVREALEAALPNAGQGFLDRLAVDLREALDALGEIVGAVTTEDVLETIFNEFCLGK